HIDGLPGDNLNQLVFDDESAWLCTSCGLAQLDPADRVMSRFTRANGLLANNVGDGVKLGDKLYFASGWGQSAGGLIVFDPATRVFTSFHRSDGMDADKLKGLAATATNQLQVIYDIDYLGPWHPGEKDYRRCLPG